MRNLITSLIAGVLTFLFIACSEENSTVFPVEGSVENISSSLQEIETSSSSIFSSSSEISSSSSVTSFSSNSETFLWKEFLWIYTGQADTVLTRFSDNTSEIVPAGRFHMIKDSPLSPKERNLLNELEIFDYEVGKDQNKFVILFTTKYDVKKMLLDSLVEGFFNTININEIREKTVNIKPSVIHEDSTVALWIFCWPDIELEKCHNIIDECSGKDLEMFDDEGFIANVPVSSLSCLGKNKDVKDLMIKPEEFALSIKSEDFQLR